MEEWKDIKGYEGIYQVSNLGRIKSLPKKNGMKLQDELIRKLQMGTNNYLIIVLNRNWEHHTYSVHRLVAETFIPNPYNFDQVNHKNGIKTDNRVDNLEWCSRSQNQKHAYRMGLLNPLKNLKRIKKQVFQYDLNKNFIKEYESIKEASKQTKTNSASISRCCNLKQKTANKYIWRFKNDRLF